MGKRDDGGGREGGAKRGGREIGRGRHRESGAVGGWGRGVGRWGGGRRDRERVGG